MSFLENILTKKNKLKVTETVVTCVDGKRYIESKNENAALPPTNYGFVIDTKPDDVPVMIVDHLFIGSQDCAVDRVLEEYNITNVLSLGIQVSVRAKYKYVHCLDLPETDIGSVVEECLPFIHSAVVTNTENILVHCNAGISRTSMVALAYLMSTGMTYEGAYALVKSRRPAIQPNAGFVKQLKNMNFTNLLK